jgi:hypothetical protein
MSEELRARVLAAAAAETSPTRADVGRRNLLISFVAAASGLGAFVIFTALMSEGHLLRLGGQVAPDQYLERPVGLVATSVGGALVVAATAVWLALRRGRSMLGRSRRRLLWGAALMPISLLAWKVGCSIAFGASMVAWPERPGERCLALSLFVAAGPLLSFLAIRRSAPVQPALNGAVIGFAAGAFAWVAADLWCPIAYVPHVLLGHLLPLGVLAGIGALLGRALLAPRSR